jgi:predicted dehydrogenase
MAERSLGIGVAGTGAVAGAHIDNWQQVEGAEVVALSSRRRDAAEQKISDHGLVNATAYDDFHKLLSDQRVDVVNLCTPHFAHPDETVAAAEAGKHIVIEKPVALNRSDLQRMLQAVQQAGVLTSVCFELHWIGSFQNTRALAQRGDLGELFYAEAAYNHGIKRGNPQFNWGHHTKEAGGSAFLTVGCHALDAVLHLLDDRAATVSAFAQTTTANEEGYEYPANAVAIMQTENGRIAKASVSLESENPYHFPVTVQGHKGSVVDQFYYSASLPAGTGWNELATDVPASGDPAHHPYKGQFEHFKHCIDHGLTPENDLVAAGHVHDACFAIDQSIEQGGAAVRVEPTRP